jgi:hypothetical protein
MSLVAAVRRRLVSLHRRRPQRAFWLRLQQRPDLAQRLDARRERKAGGVDDAVELGDQRGNLLVGQVQIHRGGEGSSDEADVITLIDVPRPRSDRAAHR